MKGFFLTTLLLITSVAGKTQNLVERDSSEPKSTFEITINGKKYTVSENEELKLDTLLKPIISIKLSAYKKFDNGSISFEYPKHFSFESSQDPGVDTWTLNGKNVNVFVFDFESKVALSTLVDQTVLKFGKDNCIVKDIQKELNHRMWNGKSIDVLLAGQHVLLECLDIKLKDGKSHFIYFQDAMEDNQNSKEYGQALNVIDSTITFK